MLLTLKEIRTSLNDQKKTSDRNQEGASSVSSDHLLPKHGAKPDSPDVVIVNTGSSDSESYSESSDGSSSDSTDPEESVSLRQTLLSARRTQTSVVTTSPRETSPIRTFTPISQDEEEFYRAQFKRPVRKTLEEIQQSRAKRQKKSQRKGRRKRRKKSKPKATATKGKKC